MGFINTNKQRLRFWYVKVATNLVEFQWIVFTNEKALMCSRSVYSSRLIHTCSGNQGCYSLNWDTAQLFMSSFFKELTTQDWKTFCLNCGGSLKRGSLVRVLPSETPTNTIGFTPFPTRRGWDLIALLKSITSTKDSSLFFFIPNPSSYVSGDFTKRCVNCFPGSLISLQNHICS